MASERLRGEENVEKRQQCDISSTEAYFFVVVGILSVYFPRLE